MVVPTPLGCCEDLVRSTFMKDFGTEHVFLRKGDLARLTGVVSGRAGLLHVSTVILGRCTQLLHVQPHPLTHVQTSQCGIPRTLLLHLSPHSTYRLVCLSAHLHLFILCFPPKSELKSQTSLAGGCTGSLLCCCWSCF